MITEIKLDIEELSDAYKDGYRDGFNKALDVMREQIVGLAMEFTKQSETLNNTQYFMAKHYEDKLREKASKCR